MPTSPYTILPFNDTNLAIALSNHLNSADIIKLKNHYSYFLEYLGKADGISAEIIVVENKYLSKSYLIDYSNYYSTCFNDYERFCKRVHFFSNSFTESQFADAIKNEDLKDSEIWGGYLGYIVIKPLSGVTIGATILKTYVEDNVTGRHFPVTKDYSVNLFGKELNVVSLAFQEQDSVVGACASSALWSAFHKTSQLFQTPLPSPSDITKSAKNLFQSSGRTFPNGGLDHYQIGNAIESVGLVSELRNRGTVSNISFVKGFLYAYSQIGLPVMLGIQLPLGGHLITTTGYKIGDISAFKRKPQITLLSEYIEKIYAHDDQVGPFSRLSFSGTGTLITGWIDRATGANMEADLKSLFVPIHNKVRLTYENIFAQITLIDFYFSQSFLAINFIWDIHLDFSNNYKKEYYSKKLDAFKYERLTTVMPKYIWVARGIVDNVCVIEFLFDATEIVTANYCIDIYIYNASFSSVLLTNLEEGAVRDFLVNQLIGPYYYNLLVAAASK